MEHQLQRFRPLKSTRAVQAVCYFLCALFVSLGGGATSASAVTIGGVEYERVVSGQLDGYFGIWRKYQKGSTYTVHPSELSVNVRSTTYFDDDLRADGTPSRFISNFMTSSANYFGAVTAADINITASDGSSLLSLEYANFGSVSGSLKLGTAGEADLVALYRVVGGSWFDAGTLIYATLNYSSGIGYARNDFYWTNGSFNLFARPAGPPTEVPEPATAALLLASLAGVSIRRRKKLPE